MIYCGPSCVGSLGLLLSRQKLVKLGQKSSALLNTRLLCQGPDSSVLSLLFRDAESRLRQEAANLLLSDLNYVSVLLEHQTTMANEEEEIALSLSYPRVLFLDTSYVHVMSLLTPDC